MVNTRVVRPLLVVLAYLAALGFLFDWRPWEILTAFGGRPTYFALVGITLAALFPRPLARLAERFLAIPGRAWMLASGAAVTLASALIAVFPLERLPHVTDEINYLFQARLFATGHLSLPSPVLPEFFHFTFLLNDGRWLSLFQPGWPLVLAPFAALGLEWLAAPLFAGLATALLYPLGRRTLGEAPARLGGLLFVFAPLNLGLSAVMMAHALSLVLTEAALLFALTLNERPTRRLAFGLGLMIGLLFLTRALNGVLMGVLLGAFLLPALWGRRLGVGVLACALLGLSLGVGAQLATNQAVTGHALSFPQDRYFAATEPKPDCHRLGFGPGVGCPLIHQGADFNKPEGFTFDDALRVTHTRLGTFLITLFGLQLLLLPIGLPLLAGPNRRGAALLSAVFIAHVVAYFAFYFHGFWGRYYYEGAGALMLLSASGLLILHDRAARFRQGLAQRLARALAPGLLLAVFAFNLAIFLPSIITMLGSFFYGVDGRLKTYDERFPAPSLIFVGNTYQLGFLAERFDGDTLPARLYVHDLGPNNALMQLANPERRAFRLDPLSGKSEELALPPDTTPTHFTIEAEYKAPIWERSPEFPEIRTTPEGGFLHMPARGAGSFLAFKQPIYAAGNATLTARLAVGPDYGRLRVMLDGRILGDLDLYAPAPGVRDFILPQNETLRFEVGASRLSFLVIGKNPKSAGFAFALDRLSFAARPPTP